jgi:hypothetical protein
MRPAQKRDIKAREIVGKATRRGIWKYWQFISQGDSVAKKEAAAQARRKAHFTFRRVGESELHKRGPLCGLLRG